MNIYYFFAIFFGALASYLTYLGSQMESSAGDKLLSTDVKKHIDKGNESIKHPIFPIEFAGGIAVDYTVFSDFHEIENLARVVIKNKDKIRALGFDIRVNNNGNELSLVSFYSLSHTRDKAINKKVPYLDDFQRTVVSNFFPLIKVHFYSQKPVDREAPGNMTIQLKDYKTHITIDIDKKNIWLEFRSLSMFDPLPNDRSITSLYDCLNGEVKIEVAATQGWHRQGQPIRLRPYHAINYFCFRVGPNRESYGYRKDGLGTGSATPFPGSEPPILYSVKHTISGDKILSQDCIYFNNRIFEDTII